MKNKETLQFIKKNKYNNSMKYFTFLLVLIFSMSFISAAEGHTRYEDLTFSVSSNNATSCTLTNLVTPDQVIEINQVGSKNSQTFTFNVLAGNFSDLGFNRMIIECTDGESSTTGYEDREVTPSGNNGASNIVFFIFVILLLYALNLIAFFGKNIPLTILSGMALLFLGVYLINNGVIIYQDSLTNYLAYVTIAWGSISAIWAALEQFDII